MPLGDLQAGLAGNDQQFCARVKAALLKAAVAIQNEATGTANHSVRIALVGRILSSPDIYAQRFAPVVAVQTTPFAAASLSAIADIDIETAVNSVYDTFALNSV